MKSEAEVRARLVANIVFAFAMVIFFSLSVAQGQVLLALLFGGMTAWFYCATIILLKLGGGGGG